MPRRRSSPTVRRLIASGLGAAVLAGSLTACSAIEPWPVLADVQDALPDAVAASDLIVVGDVIDRVERGDETLVSIRVSTSYDPAGLGSATDASGADRSPATDDDRLVTVVQDGLPADERTPAPLLQPGRSYLLFLTRSAVAAVPEYRIYDVDAGIYTVDPAGWFNHLAKGADGFLPTRLAPHDLE